MSRQIMIDGYPNNFARGISRPECLDGRKIHRCVFDFDKGVNNEGLKEISIQWLDDIDAVNEIKSRKKNGTIQYQLGFAIVGKKILDELCRVFEYQGLKYTRSPSKGNKHHGLILMNDVKESLKRREISSELALRADYYSYDEELPLS